MCLSHKMRMSKVTRRRSENWTSRKRHDREKKYSSDVNIWLVSDLGIIMLDQHCQFLCRMLLNLQNSQIPLNLTRMDQYLMVSLIVLFICVIKKSSSDKKYRHGTVMILLYHIITSEIFHSSKILKLSHCKSIGN